MRGWKLQWRNVLGCGDWFGLDLREVGSLPCVELDLEREGYPIRLM